ncbi:MAG: 3-deoxy-8-phosphooctulonate synthase [Marinilabiliales bacterium]
MKKPDVIVGNINCSSGDLFLITGPCVIESDKIMFETAEKIKKVSEKLKIPVIFKSSFTKDNRSSVKYYSGPGLDKGLKILEKIKTDYKFPVLTDIHYPSQAVPVSQVVDVIQIPAYLAMQTSLVLEAAKTGKTLNLKHAQFLAPENMIKPVEKAESTGNTSIILTERGYTFGYNDLVVDPRSFYHLNQIGYPVVFDVTHSIRKYGIPSANPEGGARQYLKTLAFAGTAAGINGLFIETHPCPSEALCDAASQLDVSQLEEFLKPLIEIHNTVKKYK